MTPARLLQYFDQISEAPDAVPRLRRLVLDLAMRGRLVRQDPTDEPASALLREFQEGHAQSGGDCDQEGKGNLSRGDCEPLPAIAPRNWAVVPLIRLGTWAIGSGFPKNEQGSQEGPFFFIKVSDMNLPGNEKYIRSAQNCIDVEAATRMKARIHPPGTIVFPKIGGAIATNKRRILTRESAIDNNCLGIKFSSPLSIEWCYLLLTTLDFAKYQAGTAVPALQQGVLGAIPVWLPPLAEQYRIVAKVDELMALCDELEAAQAKRERRRDRLVAATLHGMNNGDASAEPGARSSFEDTARFYFNHLPRLTTRPDHIHQLRQTILNLAVRGKLVPQDLRDEPASKILPKVIAARRQLSGNMEADAASEPFGPDDLMQVPDGWKAVRFREVLLALQTGPFGSSLHQRDYEEGGIPVVNPASIQDERIVPIDKMAVGRETLKRLAAFKLQKNDVVMARRGEMGRCAVVTEEEAGWLCGTGSLVLRFTDDISPWFIVKLMRAPGIRSYLGGASVGSTMQNLNQSILREMPIALPPLAEQHRIVAKVDELMALCDELEARLTATATTRRKLLEATLQEALEGGMFQLG